jgi:hypothetical protein
MLKPLARLLCLRACSRRSHHLGTPANGPYGPNTPDAWYCEQLQEVPPDQGW